ncbi:MAG: hypothetical protein SPF17_02730 [Candidatus Mucispirillum faecigallinarum]|uniref:Uncharacterized protein n=1 Tax=Candidatus Mucispirillum faecigallinarum TaxID=2838699 RepID=A0A9D2KA82_9BACT|nr:hypothetical protein [Mucispirillum sp.]MDY5050311.1 hypothetical protein [Candidatus Mucispirillum faecigallinarum]HIZ88475.1 hypothetical protein [Candidatus Mucispirillum faecigallinarum]
MNSNTLINDLSVVREYFSHNLRTSTAMVVATVSIFKFGLSDDTDNMADMIIESSYFLDVYDKGMEVLFNYVLGKPIRNDKEAFDPVKITGKVIEDLRSSIKEQNINVLCFFEDMKPVETNSYVAKTLLELILCEEIRKCTSDLTISSRDNILLIKKTKGTKNPEIYNIFARFFKEFNIEFTYTEDTLTLRFA